MDISFFTIIKLLILILQSNYQFPFYIQIILIILLLLFYHINHRFLIVIIFIL